MHESGNTRKLPLSEKKVLAGQTAYSTRFNNKNSQIIYMISGSGGGAGYVELASALF